MRKNVFSATKLLLAAVAVFALVTVISCTKSATTTTPTTTTPTSTTPPTTTPPTTTVPAPTITITSPTGNIVPQIGKVTVTVSVANFNLVDKLGQTNVVGQGHIHYFLDVDPPTTPVNWL